MIKNSATRFAIAAILSTVAGCALIRPLIDDTPERSSSAVSQPGMLANPGDSTPAHSLADKPHQITSGPRNRAIHSQRTRPVPGYDPTVPDARPSCGDQCGGEGERVRASIWFWPG